MLERTRTKDTTTVTFILPADHPHEQISVVGDFNDWQPGAHPLADRKDGTRAVSIAMPAERCFGFRYLAEGDRWFDDERADSHDGTNGYLHT
ncbi:isoamylase early set domain-containing protein [Streptomyces sp. H10-C2]|uniref:isoamylase early set domain-containing protein n=1 Tax=unclassified Streptomyces TaxID=2593676 RepID=UPI0024BB9DF7|nr:MULTISPECIES: isoamylase early set domain-containing protein [unclassified Streptomyces]MDJ0347490.1 isoamylase early set domain-containing protein [Streptomyces sp. PH10-H1]MDJ0375719.1 isoamylase early set domain-containing protein [Streptomyces sp. H10-C2]